MFPRASQLAAATGPSPPGINYIVKILSANFQYQKQEIRTMQTLLPFSKSFESLVWFPV
jgi:hypothetical protein